MEAAGDSEGEEKPAEADEALVSEEEDISSSVSSSRAYVLRGITSTNLDWIH